MDPLCILKSPSQPHTKRHIVILCSTYISLWWDIHIPIYWYSCDWRNYLLPILTKMFFFCYLMGPVGPFNDQTGPILFPSYPSTHIYVHVKTEAIWQKLFMFKSKIWTKYHSFHIWGVLGGPYVKTKVTNFVWKYDLLTVQICIIRGKNNYQFFM